MISISSYQIRRPKVTFTTGALLTANVAQEIVNPVANTRGILVDYLSALGTNATGFAGYSLVAKSSAPANFQDGTVIALCNRVSLIGSTWFNFLDVSSPIFIPAGLGLYFCSNMSEVSGVRVVQYSIL